MKALVFSLMFCTGVLTCTARETSLAEAEKNPAIVTSLVLNGANNEAARLLKLAPRMTALTEVIIDKVNDGATATELVASTAACNTVTSVQFRNCTFERLPANLKMLGNVRSFTSDNTRVNDEEHFYHAIGDMPNVENVRVIGSDFRSLPKSFTRMRVMKNVSLVNQDLQLARGFDLNTKRPEELAVSDTVQFGFGADALNLDYTCFNAEACFAHLQMFRDVLQGAYRASNTFYTPLQQKIFRKHHPLVKPPVAGMDVYPDVYSYSAMTGTSFEYGSGTKISIPEMAFEDANGSPVTGNVNITYREFRDPIDIVLSGIPMKYDSAGTSGDFESAGMFEINASQNGTEVYLKDGKKIGVDFAVVDTATGYNFYRLDEKNGWQYLESTGAVEQEMVPVQDSVQAGLSKATSYYLEKMRSTVVTPITEDTTSFDRRYADSTYLGIWKYEKAEDKMFWKAKRKASSHLYLRKCASGKDYTLVRVMSVQYYSGNPELNAYSGYYWKIDGKFNSQSLGMEYGKKTGINDCRIINEGGEYFIELKYYWGFKRVKAEPVGMDDHRKPKTLSDRTKENLFAKYTTRLNNRRNKLKRQTAKVVKNHDRSVERASKDSLRVYNNTRKLMVKEEAAMAYPDWKQYVVSEKQRTMTAQERAWQATGSVYQALTVSGMGVFNCDQVQRLVKPVQTVASKVKAAGVAVIPFIIYVIDRARNMVLTYTGNQGGGVPITYGKNATNSLLMVDGTGSLYVSDSTQFRNGINTGN
ncbi:MAG TPA: hypothetical protein VK826_04525, partial [Bacteroidia bacterium]|nr:hypothetical protein [Bacteroidia bacterium]